MTYLAEANVVKPYKGTAKISDRLAVLIINGNGRYLDTNGVEYTAEVGVLQRHFTDRDAADAKKKAALMTERAALNL